MLLGDIFFLEHSQGLFLSIELYENYTKKKLPVPEKKLSGAKHALLFYTYCFIARYCVYLIRNKSHEESVIDISNESHEESIIYNSYSLSIVLDDYEEY